MWVALRDSVVCLGKVFQLVRIGSTKSLLIFGRNLREGIPTLSTAEFPHRGTVQLSLWEG